MLGWWRCCCFRDETSAEKRLTEIFESLDEYSAADIDVKISPTGGVNVGIENALKNGVITKKYDEMETIDTESGDEASKLLSR